MSFFKVIASPVPASPTVGHTDFKKFFPAINKNTDWCTVDPLVEQAEELYIIPYISSEFYDVLETEYQNSGEIADNIKANVFRQLKVALAYYTMFHGFDTLHTRIGDAGVNENSNVDATPVRQWVFNSARWKACITGYQYLDMALRNMEKQVEAGNTDFDAFKNSEAYTITRDLLISNAITFNQFYNIGKSRKAYIALRPYIRKAEMLHIKPLLCELYEEVSSQYKNNTLTTENAALVPYIQRLLAEETILEAMPDINIVNDGDGWKVVENVHATTISQTNLQNMMQQLLSKAELNAAQFKIDLENFLYKNLDNYPTYKNSDCNQIAEDITDSCDEDLTPGAVII